MTEQNPPRPGSWSRVPIWPGLSERGPRAEPILDDSFLLLFSAAEHEMEFAIPPPGFGEQWMTVLDTADPWPARDPDAAKPGDAVLLADRALRVLRRA